MAEYNSGVQQHDTDTLRITQLWMIQKKTSQWKSCRITNTLNIKHLLPQHCLTFFSGGMWTRLPPWTTLCHGTEWDRDTLVIHGGSSRAGFPCGVFALPTEFPMTVHLVRALETWWLIKTKAQYTWQSTVREDSTVQRCFHTTLPHTSPHLRFVRNPPFIICIWNAFLLTFQAISTFIAGECLYYLCFASGECECEKK